MNDPAVDERGALSVISDSLPKLKGAGKRVAEFVLNAPQETINLTITELSARVGVSDATVVRFAQSLGYSGYHALKIRLAEDIISPMMVAHEDMMPEDGAGVAAQKSLTVGLRSLEDTLHILNTDVLEATVEAFCGARQVALFASGNSIPVALDFNFRLTHIGLSSRFSIDPTMQEMYAALMTHEDLAVGISHTGSSKETVRALELAKNGGARTVSITNHSDSPLSRHGEYCLFTATRGSQFRGEMLNSNVATFALMEALYVGICVERFDTTTVQAVSKTTRATEHRKY